MRNMYLDEKFKQTNNNMDFILNDESQASDYSRLYKKYSFCANSDISKGLYDKLGLDPSTILVGGSFSDQDFLNFVKEFNGVIHNFKIEYNDNFITLLINNKYKYDLKGYKGYSEEELFNMIKASIERYRATNNVIFVLSTENPSSINSFLKYTEGRSRIVLTSVRYKHQDVISIPNYLEYDYPSKKNGKEFWRFANAEWLEFVDIGKVLYYATFNSYKDRNEKRDPSTLYNNSLGNIKRIINMSGNIYETNNRYLNLKLSPKNASSNALKVVYNGSTVYNNDLKNYFAENDYFEINNIPVYKRINSLEISDNFDYHILTANDKKLTQEQIEYNKKYNVDVREGYGYVYNKSSEGSDKLIVTFPAYIGMSENQVFYPVSVLEKFQDKYNVLSFQDFTSILGSALIYDDNLLSIESKIVDVIKNTINRDNIKDILFYGTSKGGYTAIHYSKYFSNSKIISFAPVLDFKNFIKDYYAGSVLYDCIDYFRIEYPKIDNDMLKKKGIITYSSQDPDIQRKLFYNYKGELDLKEENGTHNEVIASGYDDLGKYLDKYFS